MIVHIKYPHNLNQIALGFVHMSTLRKLKWIKKGVELGIQALKCTSVPKGYFAPE